MFRLLSRIVMMLTVSIVILFIISTWYFGAKLHAAQGIAATATTVVGTSEATALWLEQVHGRSTILGINPQTTRAQVRGIFTRMPFNATVQQRLLGGPTDTYLLTGGSVVTVTYGRNDRAVAVRAIISGSFPIQPRLDAVTEATTTGDVKLNPAASSIDLTWALQ